MRSLGSQSQDYGTFQGDAGSRDFTSSLDRYTVSKELTNVATPLSISSSMPDLPCELTTLSNVPNKSPTVDITQSDNFIATPLETVMCIEPDATSLQYSANHLATSSGGDLYPLIPTSAHEVDSSHNWPNQQTLSSTVVRPSRKARATNRSSVWFRSLGGTHRRYYRRLVFKSGERNFSCVNIPRRGRRYLSDLFTTVIHLNWHVILAIFASSFILSWIIFGGIWYLLLSVHGDLNNPDPNWKPCVLNVYDFATAVLFSIETQHTIGYGVRSTTGNCPEAIMLMMFQCCVGLIIQALMTGMVFAKLSRPKKRAETLMFSRNAVICQRDGMRMLLFRIGDMRKAHIIQSQIRGILIKKRITTESEELPMEEYHVDLGFQEGRDRLFLAWPTLVAHHISGPSSPFWNLSADDLMKQQFELVIILEGIVECTGMTTQARTSFLPSEILWGYRFQKLLTRLHTNGEYLIDFDRFHSVEAIPNFPPESARMFAQQASHIQYSTSDLLNSSQYNADTFCRQREVADHAKEESSNSDHYGGSFRETQAHSFRKKLVDKCRGLLPSFPHF